MTADFPIVSVGEVASSVSETHKFGKERLVFLNTSDILRGKFLHRTYSIVRAWPGQAKKSIRKDDILFSEIRPANGRWAYVEHEADDFVVSTKLMVIRADSKVLFPKFLYLFLTSEKTTRWLQHLAESRSGTFPQITFDQVATLEIGLPPLQVQMAIAGVIGALDDKVESNRRAIRLAEDLADGLFRSRADRVLPLAEVGQLTMGSSPPGDTYNEQADGVPFYQGVRDFGSRFPTRRISTTGPVRFADTNDTLISVRAPVGRLNRASERCCIGRGVAALTSQWPSVAYYSLRAADELWKPFQNEGTVFGAINKTDLSKADISWVSDGTKLATLEGSLSALDSRIKSLDLEIAIMIELRDQLLPVLLSGRVGFVESREVVGVAQ